MLITGPRSETPMPAVRGCVVALLMLFASTSAAELPGTAAVGQVSGLDGNAFVTRSGTGPMPLYVDAPIHPGDRIETGAGAVLRLRFEDDSTVTLGAVSSLRITKFVYSPRSGQRSTLLDFAGGVFRAVVAHIVSESQFEVRMEHVVAAVRGTEWLGELNEQVASVVVLEGQVAVRRAQQEVVLGAREGVDARPGEALRKQRWGDARIEALRARVTLPGSAPAPSDSR
jgi:hypothetical protein